MWIYPCTHKMLTTTHARTHTYKCMCNCVRTHTQFVYVQTKPCKCVHTCSQMIQNPLSCLGLLGWVFEKASRWPQEGSASVLADKAQPVGPSSRRRAAPQNLTVPEILGYEDCCFLFPVPSVLYALLQSLGALKGVGLRLVFKVRKKRPS